MRLIPYGQQLAPLTAFHAPMNRIFEDFFGGDFAGEQRWAPSVDVKETDTEFEAELTCLTCHDPHKGRTRTILNWDASSPTDACLHCHPK